MIGDMIKRCETEIEVNKEFPLYYKGEKGTILIEKTWSMGTGSIYMQIDTNVKGLTIPNNLCTLGFFINREGAYLIFDDKKYLRIDYSKKLIRYLHNVSKNIELSSYL